jgi:hypothetical protein
MLGGALKRLWLQCGHDRKVVENTSRFFDCHFYGSLQCGHDRKVVENRIRACSFASRVELL